ncbi:outer membrane beta-barrel family protein [Chitinophaga nivalis]|uniref:TonB-dependent receptor family protein n=1 Tax=Chitinophaga nivalis TaxID=2991709 RepID=A0ABT3IL24_9BACT|nr:outer membrane beta-barrel family protein [Chitinophaga nivalis]MCW3465643.1 TonB-dependent receptor family protein [Chitinophaga nivalis]MCW3484666.1 TonB-dependent receptor family protein [Chitinophaga nivalis]
MRKIVLSLTGWMLLFHLPLLAQHPHEKNADATGALYGKLLDAQTNKPVEYASVALLRADSSVLTGMLSKPNGDFNFEHVALGKYLLKINFIGYETTFKSVALTPASNTLDVGNIRLKANVKSLAAVNVVGEKPAFTMAIDKRVFNVDKNLASIGGTATDVLKQVPSVSVDIDGNVTVRNGTPTIFIDGRPSTLTLDQIPADAIANIEVVTNPSAKYDAEGMSGILNIVLKKNKKAGINGLINLGGSSLGSANAGIDFNLRQQQFNFFLSYNIRNRVSPTTGRLFRKNMNKDTSFLEQLQEGDFYRKFQNGRIGFDWFIDNRNTLTVSQSLTGGNFNRYNNQTLHEMDARQQPLRYGTGVDNTRNGFRNYTTQLGYKHTFAKEGEELTADFTYNRATGDNSSEYSLQYYNLNGDPIYDPKRPEERYGEGKGTTTYLTGQVDYVKPFTPTSKIEAGLRTNNRRFDNYTNTMGKQYPGGNFLLDSALSNNYHYQEQINAAYVSYTGAKNDFGYQVGLRAEQSNYSGETRLGTKESYKINYPVSLFPSLFLSQKLKGDHELQLNYSRRIRRPWFRDLLPTIEYSGQSASRGNPELKPEFTNSFELSYLKDIAHKHNILVSLYYRNTNNAITDFYVDTTLNLNGQTQRVLLSYPINANTRNSYGAEITLRSQLTSYWDLTTNVNLAQTKINASGNGDNLSNQGFIWFGKVNSNTKLPWNLTLQIAGEYESRQILPQGQREPSWSIDAAIKKDLLKNKALSISLGINDIFNSDRNLSYTNTAFSEQENYRKRLTRELRLNATWRFGKLDTHLFKRKSNKSKEGNMEMNNGEGN